MLNLVHYHLTKHSYCPITDEYSYLKQKIKAFKDSLDYIDQLEKEISPSASAVIKNRYRQELKTNILIIHGFLKVYAQAQQEPEVVVHSLKTKLSDRVGSVAFAKTCEEVILKAAKRTEALKPYGLKEEVLATARALFISYNEFIDQPRQDLRQHYLNKQRLDQAIRQSLHLLRNEIDPVMIQFSTSHPEWYYQYTRAKRVIHYRAKRKKKMKE